MTPDSSGSVDANRPDRRPDAAAWIRRAGALAAAASLAGCTSGDGGTADGASPEGSGSAETDSGSDTDDVEDLDMTEEECEREAEDLAAELEALEADRAAVETELAAVENDVDRLELERAEFESLPDDVLASAESVGVAAREAVVYLEFDGAHATGWFVDDTHVLTNAHNLLDNETGRIRDGPTLWTVDGDSFGSSVVELEESLFPDVALLESDQSTPQSLDFADSRAGEGEHVVQVGHPGGAGNWRISVGEVLRYQLVGPRGAETEELLTDVPGASGNSGSPLLDFDGSVVGLTTGASDADQRGIGEAPEPHPSIVYDRHLSQRVESRHVPLAVVRDRYDRWT